MKPRCENTKNYTDQVKLLVYNMERTIDHMDANRGVQQWVWIIDYNGFSMSNAPPMSVSKETLNFLSNQYPERLGVAFCVDPPFYLYVIALVFPSRSLFHFLFALSPSLLFSSLFCSLPLKFALSL
jgi:hypothetical protein